MKTPILMATLGIALLANGCKSPEQHESPSTTLAVKKAWHCPMHPQIVRDHEGHCPICGMELVPFETSDAASVAAAPKDAMDKPDEAKTPAGKAVRVDPSVLRKIGVRTETVDAGTLGGEVAADAEGVLDEAAEASVTVRAMGYLQDVATLRAGDHVKRGQILANFYSPEIVAAQGDWLASRQAGDSAAAKASQERLASLGLPATLL